MFITMKHIRFTCDIRGEIHEGDVFTREVPVMFDHDQEDGKSKTRPYFEMHDVDVCDSCFRYMTEQRRLIYAHGAMGHNNYTL